MQTKLSIRHEISGDATDIDDITTAAFDRRDEAALVAKLREDRDVVLSLVAEEQGQMIGHILLSTMKAPFKALGLAPVSVHPDHQNKGVGSALIRCAIEGARKRDFDAIFLLGAPAYYTRFGFSVDDAKTFKSPYAGPYFMALPLGAGFQRNNAQVEYAPAFQQL